jgi:hypothetical protein
MAVENVPAANLENMDMRSLLRDINSENGLHNVLHSLEMHKIKAIQTLVKKYFHNLAI